MSSKKAVLNISTSLLLQVVNSTIGFILPVILITTYGSSINGMTSSIQQFLNYLNIVEAGIGAASIAVLYKPLSEKNSNEISDIVSSTKQFYYKSGMIFVFSTIVFSGIYAFIVKGEIDTFTAVAMVLVLGLSGASEFFFIGKYRVLITADQKMYVIIIIQIIFVIVRTLVMIVLIKMGYSIVVTQFVAMAVYICRAFFIKLYVEKKYPNINFNKLGNSQLISMRWNALVHQLTGVIVINSPIVIITILCDLKEVSVYTVYNMVFQAIALILGAFNSGVFASFGNMLVSESREHVRSNFKVYETLYFVVLFFVYSMSFILISPFIELYTRNFTDAVYLQPTLGVLFVLVGIANSLRIPANTLVTAAGHFKETQNRAILEAVINLLASILFGMKFGMIGVLMGSLVSYGYRTFDFIIYTNKYIIIQSVWVTIKKILLFLVFTFVPALFIVIYFDRFIKVDTYLHWLIIATGSGFTILSIISIILYIFERDVYKVLVKLFRKIVTKPRTKYL